MSIDRRLSTAYDDLTDAAAGGDWDRVVSDGRRIERRQRSLQRVVVASVVVAGTFLMLRAEGGLGVEVDVPAADGGSAEEGSTFVRFALGLLPWLMSLSVGMAVWLGAPESLRQPYLGSRSSRLTRALLAAAVPAMSTHVVVAVALFVGAWNTHIGTGSIQASYAVGVGALVAAALLPVREFRQRNGLIRVGAGLAASIAVSLATTLLSNAVTAPTRGIALVSATIAMVALMVVVSLGRRFSWDMDTGLGQRFAALPARRRIACLGGIVGVLLTVGGCLTAAWISASLHQHVQVDGRAHPQDVGAPLLSDQNPPLLVSDRVLFHDPNLAVFAEAQLDGSLVTVGPSWILVDLIDRSALSGARTAIWLGLLIMLVAGVANRVEFGGRFRQVVAGLGVLIVIVVPFSEWRMTSAAIGSMPSPEGATRVAEWAGWSPLTGTNFDGAVVFRWTEPLGSADATVLRNRLRESGWSSSYDDSDRIIVQVPGSITERASAESLTADMVRVRPLSDDGDDAISIVALLLGIGLVAVSIPPAPRSPVRPDQL